MEEDLYTRYKEERMQIKERDIRKNGGINEQNTRKNGGRLKNKIQGRNEED